MPLKRIASCFPEVVHTPPVTIVDRQGWLMAQRCDAWWRDELDEDPVTLLLVYRSPLVTPHKRMYKPVADLILAANRFEVISQGTRHDDNMIHGDKGAEYFYARMTDAAEFPKGPYDLREVIDVIDEAVHGALSQTMEVA
ncbi:hypothetical protein PBI_CHE12_79 [Mycobacterium phage Che12]|uniref:Uncharacterized protein n=1 Tax=Mycobacterium phage Che12 TaxID=2911435 RepID=Q1A0D8_9CAUD|nr:gp79 [Mycobacterium phage Che12]ABE67398.1 hypothetical protein PBI_CHE12_79 [Mycobacterium phage Che12]